MDGETGQPIDDEGDMVVVGSTAATKRPLRSTKHRMTIRGGEAGGGGGGSGE